jgi:molybdopterin-guanine dinucleotide biosynthesis protein A
MTFIDQITLAILAGGESSRMGKSKAGLRVDNIAILSWLLRKFRWDGPTLLVTSPGREHPSGCSDFDSEVVDPVAGVGPIRGLLTALENVTTQMLVVATVDMPMVEREQLLWLVSELIAKPQAAGCMCRNEKEVQPFPSAWRCDLARKIVREHFDAGRRSVYSLQDHSNVIVADAPVAWPTSTWLNLNYPRDLEELKKFGVGSAGF